MPSKKPSNNQSRKKTSHFPSFHGLVISRQGSERLPGKATMPLHGKPMICHTLDAAVSANHLEKTWVFSDNPIVLALAHEKAVVTDKLAVPNFPRPESLNGPDADAHDTIRYFLSKLPADERPEFLVLLQPTSPLRTPLDIDTAIAMMLDGQADDAKQNVDSVISVCQPSKPLHWAYEVSEHATAGSLQLKPANLPSKNFVMPNGAIYIARTKDLLDGKRLDSGNVLGYEMPFHRSIDIDTVEDFIFAQALMEHAHGPAILGHPEKSGPEKSGIDKTLAFRKLFSHSDG